MRQFAVVAPMAAGAARLDAELPYPVYRLPAPSDAMPLAAGIDCPSSHKHLVLRARCTRSGQLPGRGSSPGGSSARTRGHRGPRARASHRPFSSVPLLRKGYEKLRRRTLCSADRVLAVSSFTASLVTRLGVDERRVSVVPNGTNPERFAPMATESARAALGLGPGPLLLTIARLVPRKGIDSVLRVLPRLRAQITNLRYVVIGSGPDLQRLKALSERLGLRESVSFVGKVQDSELPRWYNACDVFVMPARSDHRDVEGFGLVFLEASACGKPAIGSREGGVTDAVVHERTGLLVEPGDDNGLAEALHRLLSDPSFAQKLGAGGRAFALSCSWDYVADRLLSEIGGAHSG